MLEAYVIAEVAAILRDGYYHLHGKGLSAEVERDINKLAQFLLPKLDNYFEHRLKVEELRNKIDTLEKIYEKLGEDKASNDKDYLELSGKCNYLTKKLELREELVDILTEYLKENRK